MSLHSYIFYVSFSTLCTSYHILPDCKYISLTFPLFYISYLFYNQESQSFKTFRCSFIYVPLGVILPSVTSTFCGFYFSKCLSLFLLIILFPYRQYDYRLETYLCSLGSVSSYYRWYTTFSYSVSCQQMRYFYEGRSSLLLL